VGPNGTGGVFGRRLFFAHLLVAQSEKSQGVLGTESTKSSPAGEAVLVWFVQSIRQPRKAATSGRGWRAVDGAAQPAAIAPCRCGLVGFAFGGFEILSPLITWMALTGEKPISSSVLFV
jgi:hypothetical protein